MFKVDLHTHTVASGHAFSTVRELAYQAGTVGLEAIAVTDHGPSMEGAAHEGYFSMGYRFPKHICGVRTFFGCEANIIDVKGNLDLNPQILERLDIVLVGLHSRTPYPSDSDKDVNTNSMIRAIERNRIHVIAHPQTKYFPVHVDEVAKTALKYGVMLELNLSLLGANYYESAEFEMKEMIRTAFALGHKKFVVSTDAHIADEVGCFESVKKFDLPIDRGLILGATEGVKEVQEFLSSK